MELQHVLILSVVEGVTEFLPISSTAHLILTSHVLNIPSSEFLSTFEVSIQVGAIASVVVLYWRKIMTNKSLFVKACIGFVPTGLVGALFYKHIKIILSDPFVPVIALFIGGIAIIGIEKMFDNRFKENGKNGSKTTKEMTYKDALGIGLMQCISMIPGVSRAATSIFGGMSLGLTRQAAVDFAFLLAIPTMVAATTLDLIQTSSNFSSDQVFQLSLGILASFITALFVVKWLIKFVQTNNFIWFGVYRILLSIVYFLIFLR